MEYIRYIFFLKEEDEFNITDLFLMAIKWNKASNNLPTTDHNRTVIKVFKNKKNLIAAFDALDKAGNRLLDKLDDLYKREFRRGCYVSALTDSRIRTLIRMNQEDLREVRLELSNFIWDSSIHPVNLWMFCNKTAKASIKSKGKWIEKIVNPVWVERMKKATPPKTEEWLAVNMNPDSFNEEKYRDDQRSDELHTRNYAQFRDFMAWSQQGFMNTQFNKKGTRINPSKNTTSSNNNNISTQNNIKKTQSNPPKRKKTSKNKMFDFMNNVTKSEKWKENYFGFYHYPETTCKKGKKCTRSHKCPICQGDKK